MYTCHGIHKDVKKILRNQSSLSIMWVRLRRNVAQKRKHLKLIRRVKTKTKLQGWLTLSWDRTFTVRLRAASESGVNTPALSSVLGGPSQWSFCSIQQFGPTVAFTEATTDRGYFTNQFGGWTLGKDSFPCELKSPFPFILQNPKGV